MNPEAHSTISTWLSHPPESPHATALKTPMAELVYQQLHQIAAGLMRNERPGHTLQPTALVNEAYLQLLDHSANIPEARHRFLALAARVMRHVLIDHARGRNRIKRGGDLKRLDLTIEALGSDQPTFGPDDLIALDEALAQLEQLDQRKARLVELRYFAGLDEQTAADILGIARSTAAADWRFARAWLLNKMASDDQDLAP